MKLLIDMNLSPVWVDFFATHGLTAVHWSSIGDPKAPDEVILRYAKEASLVVFTHDLDFGNILAVTHAAGPSVVQVRTENPVPDAIGMVVIAALREHRSHLIRGALLTIEPDRWRGRVLPLVPGINRE